MEDFFEIDFLDVKSKKSGDAIPLRYSLNGTTRIHVTDGGFQETGDVLVKHINEYYDSPKFIDAVVVTHPDGDHAGGLRKLFEVYEIGELWMLRPWLYANELIDRFSRYTSVGSLAGRLKEIYPNIAALEELAENYNVPILEPFQGAYIGHFCVMAPTKRRYLDLIVESEKTPEAAKEEQLSLAEAAGQLVRKAINFVRAAWGQEVFPEDDTSAENNMSIIQYANLCGQKILLTGDAGRAALEEAADYAPYAGLFLPGIDRIQVPHHGSRHNVSTEILDRWLGPRLNEKSEGNSPKFTAIVSASKEDKDHPRKTVVRAFIHRGGKVLSTEGSNTRTQCNAPNREGWSAAETLPYPEDQED
ncbi:MAG TPA: MBL fold metallo-hydrolase [Gammaproteobacteria bacterium]